MGNINLVLDLVIEISEQIKVLPMLLLKPHYLQFNSVKCELIAILKITQNQRAIRAYQRARCVNGSRQRSLY